MPNSIRFRSLREDTLTAYLLGVDLGGTGAKAGVFTLEGRCVGSGYREYHMLSRLPGQAEHDAEGWWQATVSAIRSALCGIRPNDIFAVGVGCTNGLVAVDRHGCPLRPAIMLWDQRSLPEVAHIRATLGEDQVLAVTGNPVAPGAYALPTLLWLKHHEPDTYLAAHKLMAPGGYLVARLTGEFTIDYSRACTTLLFDIRSHAWHLPFLEALDIAPDKLPRPMPSQNVAGTISAEAAAATGLAVGTPVIAGCMDTLGAALGAGVVEPGEGFIIMGTAARVATAITEPRFDQRLMHCTHLQPDRWLALGALNGVGSSLRWVRDHFGQLEQSVASLTGMDVYDLLTAQAKLAPPASKGLIYLPYLAGERTPIWDPYARGVFFGVTLGHGRPEFLRAVLEGAAMAIRQAVELLEGTSDLRLRSLRLGGAAAASAVWVQIIADVLGKPVVSLAREHSEVLGAALLAGVGTGAYANLAAALSAASTGDQVYEPEPTAHSAYNHLYPVYTELYPNLKPYFERIAHLDLPQVWVTQRGNYAN